MDGGWKNPKRDKLGEGSAESAGYEDHINNTCMKVKFSTKSNRIKGLSFHSSRPWILTSLHTGVVQIWDYKLKTLIDKFEEHEGPVRGLSFHPSLPLFVTGGDDSLVKLWNYKQRKCIYTFKGHIDYIRTGFFHHELPWILTASDDQTMRIWNYQSRTCINIIAGHSHYVMCAQFHPQKNYIVSCSLDATIRLWDFSVFRKRLTESKDLSSFAGIQIECIRVLEGHERGVNWVCFHPTQNFIASGADDRKIKLWKYTSQVAWQDSQIKGHTHNVSCVAFDPKNGNLVSNSQDKTMRVWNIQTKAQLDVYKKNTERYWILTFQKSGYLLAAGHDQGFDVFSINKQRIPHTMVDAITIIFAQNMQLFMYDILKKDEKKQLYQYVPKKPNAMVSIKKLLNNPFQNNFYMVQIDEEQKNNYVIKKKQNYLTFPIVIKNYEAQDSCFVSDNKYAVLVNQNQIDFHNLEYNGNKLKSIKLALPIQRIFSFQKNCILIATKNLVAKFDFEQSKIINQYEFEQQMQIRQVLRGGFLALLSKNKMTVIDGDFEKVMEVKQKFSIKSAFWQRPNMIFYTTPNHWKYALMNGETGILKSIEEPIHIIKKLSPYKYLAFNQKKKIFEIECQKLQQLQFKLALVEKDWEVVHKLVKEMPRKGKAFIGYLIDKDYSSIALNMVSDKREEFSLAINSGQFQLAYNTCLTLNTPQFWKILGEEALKQGIFNIVEISYQKLQMWDKMSFLFLVMGNFDKLNKMIKLSQKLQDPIGRANNALMAGDPKQLVTLLQETQHNILAGLAATAHKLGNVQGLDTSVLNRLGSAPLEYCKPVVNDMSNWPHNQIEDEYLQSLAA